MDAVCAAVVAGDDLSDPLAELGASRAEAGVGLSGTLQDLAALHAVSGDDTDGLVSADPDAVPSSLLRTTALGWADAVSGMAVGREVEDPLTGLNTTGYLRTRLHEVYREAHARGSTADEDFALITVMLGVSTDGYPRMVAMVLIADALRTVFDAGETTALIRPATAAVLAPRTPQLRHRCVQARWMIENRLAADPALRDCGQIRLQEETLPGDHAAVCRLLASL
ncbi:hypothetical protein [Saccharopolyspora flava]|uniref:GGDEF domain-containing protein, diguanylate cyclase (C-di-GMP synthetase) or its enzymatically inactive variants n=1 Tax=Saccharopolyspora flava TaxID=95161 RepID=A0A1I6PKG9_9PSEU|nr:hypothetical protein [Saccharopolyspora flava]SFS40702.1 hypothetical protein SAMN05660874_00877 [Saccharopolyspora flava]